MSYVNRRSLIAAALLASISLFGGHTQIPAALATAPRLPGSRKRREKRRQARTKRFCLPAQAVRYAQLAPKVDGVRMRWAEGRLVPRDSQSALPWTKRKQERALAKKLRRKAELQQGQPPVKHIPRGTWFRGDMKGAMRAARRAGVISARQQRRLNKAGRAQS